MVEESAVARQIGLSLIRVEGVVSSLVRIIKVDACVAHVPWKSVMDEHLGGSPRMSYITFLEPHLLRVVAYWRDEDATILPLLGGFLGTLMLCNLLLR